MLRFPIVTGVSIVSSCLSRVYFLAIHTTHVLLMSHTNPSADLHLQEIFKAVQQFVKEIQAGGPVHKGSDVQPQPDKPTAKTAVSVTSTSSTAPSQVLQP